MKTGSSLCSSSFFLRAFFHYCNKEEMGVGGGWEGWCCWGVGGLRGGGWGVRFFGVFCLGFGGGGLGGGWFGGGGFGCCGGGVVWVGGVCFLGWICGGGGVFVGWGGFFGGVGVLGGFLFLGGGVGGGWFVVVGVGGCGGWVVSLLDLSFSRFGKGKIEEPLSQFLRSWADSFFLPSAPSRDFSAHFFLEKFFLTTGEGLLMIVPPLKQEN